MAKRGKNLADDGIAHDLEDVRVGLLADEDAYDRRTRWRLCFWGVGAVFAVTVAALANRSYVHNRQDRVAAADLARQSEQIQGIARESRNDIRRLSAAIDTLNSDRDRLYARATALEQGLESVTGTVTKQSAVFSHLAAPIPTLAVPDLKTVPPTTVPPASGTSATDRSSSAPSPQFVETSASTTTPLTGSVAATAPPQPAVTPPVPDTSPSVETSKVMPDARHETTNAASDVTASLPAAPVEVAVPRTRFGIDLGTARSIAGLRSLWRRITVAHPSIFTDLRPVIGVKEHKGTAGVELRLVVGPLSDAAKAAEICATLAASRHGCEPTTFEGQQLVMKAGSTAAPLPPRRRAKPRQATREHAATASAPSPAGSSATQAR